MALCRQSHDTTPETSFAAVSDTEGHTTRDGAAPVRALQRIGRCLGQPHILCFCCILHSPCKRQHLLQRGGGEKPYELRRVNKEIWQSQEAMAQGTH